uniref:RING-type E3 ubiquitin transferase n=1 Tax=Eutreptiella gymnastica TaxID=73025 RepID=A0A7S1J6L1_9EUGL|mmetsp:Transcript_72090/g.127046  ORF Transcript_72090/g.127046 Transcript_72090/m.127046 type:complete len:759 (+) Transcript_72090:188-2464(+)
MGNKLDKQLYECDVSKLHNTLKQVLIHCRNGNTKQNWQKIVSALAERVLPLISSLITEVLLDKPAAGSKEKVSRKWQKRLDYAQVILHETGAILRNLACLPSPILKAPNFDILVRSRLIPSLLWSSLQDRSTFVAQEVLQVFQRLPNSFPGVSRFSQDCASYLDNLSTYRMDSGHIMGSSPSFNQSCHPAPDVVAWVTVCKNFMDTFLHEARDTAELDSVCVTLIESEPRSECLLVLVKGLSNYLGLHILRLETTCVEILAQTVLKQIQSMLRVAGREDLCLALMECFRHLAKVYNHTASVLQVIGKVFASPHDCWLLKQLAMEALCIHLDSQLTLQCSTLIPIVTKALESMEPRVYAFPPLLLKPAPADIVLAIAKNALLCVSKLVSHSCPEEMVTLLAHIAKAVMLYADPCLEESLVCVAKLLVAKGNDSLTTQKQFWQVLIGVLADTLSFPSLFESMCNSDIVFKLSTEGASAQSVVSDDAHQQTHQQLWDTLHSKHEMTEAPPAGREVNTTKANIMKPLESWLTLHSLDFYEWTSSGFAVNLPDMIAQNNRASIKSIQQCFSILTPKYNDQLRMMCQRVAACIITFVSSTDDKMVAEDSFQVFLTVLEKSNTIRPWMVPNCPFMLHFGKYVCSLVATQIVTCQRDAFISSLKVESRSLQLRVDQLQADKATLQSRLEDSLKQNERNRRLQVSMQCSVCLDTLAENKPSALQCGHMFHFDCIEQVLNSASSGQAKCPLCRNRITSQPLLLKGLED